jgi:hypothetical protein
MFVKLFLLITFFGYIFLQLFTASTGVLCQLMCSLSPLFEIPSSTGVLCQLMCSLSQLFEILAGVHGGLSALFEISASTL